MSRYEYFDELSGDDSLHESGESDSDRDDNDPTSTTNRATSEMSANNSDSKTSHERNDRRIILHADVDCFYCQCEIMDRKLDPERPLAIGQKHIIVTSNYAARAIGITKLTDRKKAQEMGGSSLLVVDGSDLQRYRIHGRKIYESFRRSVKSIDPNSCVRKGCMDEMMADISTVPLLDRSMQVNITNPNDIFTYNDSSNGTSTSITLTEDQSGAQTTVTRRVDKESVRSFLPKIGDSNDVAFQERLRNAAILAIQIRQSILDETGFTVTMGISYNPMMAKIGSGLRKPGKVNVLPPCYASQQLIHSMPLRKINGIGSRTMKVLKPCLEQRHGRISDNNSPWVCRDLLEVPYSHIIQCLNNLQNGPSSSADQCDQILDLCNGIDNSLIVDDDGTLQKSLSVENSLRRGTIRTNDQVLHVVEDLYRRLPLLLKDRKEWSEHPSLAYPTVIRVTARSSFDPIGKGRRDRSFITRSQQSKFDGGRAICNDGLTEPEAAVILRQHVTPLLQSLLFTSRTINVTRLNICVTNFQDIDVIPPSNQTRLQTLHSFMSSHDKSQR